MIDETLEVARGNRSQAEGAQIAEQGHRHARLVTIRVRQHDPVLGGATQYFDANCFSLPDAGFFGDVARNTIIGPRFASWDMAVFKNIGVGQSRRIQLRAEGFNITNRANFGLPASTVFNSAGRVANAGEITSIVGTARQFQFGVKVDF